MAQLLDGIIQGIGLIGITFIISLIFGFKEKVSVVVFLALFGFLYFTEEGNEIRERLTFFDKSSTWNKLSKGVVVMQCSAFTTGKLTVDLNKTSENIKSSNEDTRALIRCCANNVFRKISQEEYFKNDNAMPVFDAIEKCKK
ncbi:hypothetical protein AAX26_00635 [Aliarcobacter thereius]|uniref:hypothetical protein n=1 Tax=Aliarcobacter thereius TaxID=544718 RepID=UPI0008286B99|nr:hypothetical protein [Aliarcobacter thereius]OCL87550.1 hypothetical protein AAX26_00635 [Aliarcobacter thereius]